MKIDNKTTEYVNKLKDIKLSDSSRARMESNLLEYARFHGVRVGEDSRFIEQVPQRTSLLNLFKSKSMTAAIIAIMIIAGGGTSYAAEGAVPGDFLYSIKTEVNENVKSAFAISNEAEASLQARLAEERLEEAEELAARGELSADTSSEIGTRLKAHYEEAEMRSDKSEADGDYESSATVRASLEGSLRTHADILSNLNTTVSGNNGASLITDIRNYADAAAKAQATATVDVSADVKADIEATIRKADTMLAESETKLIRAKTKISADVYTRIEGRLVKAMEAQAEAKASLSAELYSEAYAGAQSVIRMTNEVQVMTNSAMKLQLNVGVQADSIIDSTKDVMGDVNVQINSDSETDANTQGQTGSDMNTETKVDLKNNTSVDASSTDLEVNLNSSLNLGTQSR